METLKLPFDSISLDPGVFTNVREQTGDIEGLAKDIAENGLLSPLTVWKVDGRYHLIAGFRRHAALALLASQAAEGEEDWSLVPCHAYEGNLEGATVINLTENMSRRDLSLYEIAKRCHEMSLPPLELSGNKIAARLASGASEEGQWSGKYVNKLVKFVAELHPTILSHWALGKGEHKGAMATIGRLEKLAYIKDQKVQLDTWLHDSAMLNIPRGEEGDEEIEVTTPEAAEKAPREKKIRSRKPEEIALALVNVRKTKVKNHAWVLGATEALEWAKGDAADIPDVYPGRLTTKEENEEIVKESLDRVTKVKNGKAEKGKAKGRRGEARR